jgi:hypothetical protein
MKNKIILLLVLLIPSIVFGESVKFGFDYETGRPNSLLISITHSSLANSDGNKKAGFNLYSATLVNGKIFSFPKKEKLSNDYEAFLRWMKEKFPIGFDVVKNKWNPKEDIITFVENLMIFNGYTLVNTEDSGSQRYYFK